MAKQGNIVSYTTAQIEEMIARGEDRTDWARVDAMTEEELEAAIASDPDEPGLVWDSHNPIVGKPGSPEAVALQIDGDILEFFHKGESDFNKRINDVLRSYVNEARRRSA